MGPYTPGPWFADRVDGIWDVVTSTGDTIAEAGDLPDPEEVAANMILMAAAPDLMAACEAAMNWIDRLGEHAPMIFDGEAAVSDQLYAAIVKARGE